MTSKAALLGALIIFVWTLTAPIATGHRDSRLEPDAVTDPQLKSILDGLGYEPKPLSKGYLIAIKRDSWTYNMQLVLSPDGSKLGFNSNLGKVDEPSSVTGDAWLKLLQANADVDPSFFYFDKDQHKLYLHRVLDNRGLTPAYIREQVDAFCGNIKGTADLWKFTK